MPLHVTCRFRRNCLGSGGQVDWLHAARRKSGGLQVFIGESFEAVAEHAAKLSYALSESPGREYTVFSKRGS